MENKTTLSEEKFSILFGSWWSKIRPFFINGGLDPIYAFLKKESARGKHLCPLSENVFRCFRETPLDEMKVCLVGLSPYHLYRNNLPIADGLLFGCSITNYPQPSLEQWYSSCEFELYNGLNLNYKKNPDVSFLAKQGVLMLNAALTTSEHKPGDHCFLWEPFMKYLFEEVIGVTGVPIVFLGREAQKLEKYTMPFTWVFKLSHPASASYQGTDWPSEGMFGKLNKILKDRNNEKINWLDIPEEPNTEYNMNDLPF